MSCTQRALAGLVALFMVLLLPSCLYGTLSRATATAELPTNGNEEERDKHEERAEVEAVHEHAAPTRMRVARTADAWAVFPVRKRHARVVSVAPRPDLARFSVRRQR